MRNIINKTIVIEMRNKGKRWKKSIKNVNYIFNTSR